MQPRAIPSSARRVRCRAGARPCWSRSMLISSIAVADGSGVSASVVTPAPWSSSMPSGVSAPNRANGSVKTAPMDARAARRANGSALVASSSRPSMPSAVAVRTIAPRFVGLSTASSTTRRLLRRTSAAGSVAVSGRWKSATTSSGTPSPVASRRTPGPAANTGTSGGARSATAGRRRSSTSIACIRCPAANARSTTRSPSATNNPASVLPWRRPVVRPRSRKRKLAMRGSSGSETTIGGGRSLTPTADRAPGGRAARR